MLTQLQSIWRGIFGSIRGRILLLVLVTAVPLVAERIQSLENGRKDRLRLASHQLLDLANDGLARQNAMLSGAQALLQTIAAAAPPSSIRNDCQQLLGKIGTPLPSISSLLISLPQGQIVCSTLPEAVGLDVSDRPYFIQTLASKSPVVSDFLISRATTLPIVIATHPVLNKDGRVEAVLMAALRLDWMATLLVEPAMRVDMAALILDTNGTLIAREPNNKGFVGAKVTDAGMLRAIKEGQRTFAGTDLDGKRRIFAASRMNDEDSFLIVGMLESDVLANINQQVYFAYGSLAAVTLIVLLAAWFGGQRFIVRPIQSLAIMASAVGRGDYRVSQIPMNVPEEFRPLQAAIRSMATRLSERENAMKRANEQLGRLAQVDALTGLCNRGSFDAQLVAEHQHARESGNPLAVILIDVDHFKAFNDQYGHVAGDACLREVAKAIENMVRGTDFAARYGGEEFVVIGRNMTVEAAIIAAERMRAAVRALGVPHERSPHRCVTISIGIASTVPSDGELPERLVEEADVALYAAKKQGRDRVATGADVFALAG